MIKQISSVQNPLIKDLLLLKDKSRTRKKTNTFLIEGDREITLALTGGYTISRILFDSSIINGSEIIDRFNNSQIEFIEISPEIYKKLTYRSSTEGIIAVANFENLVLSNLELNSKSPLILVAEAPEKPGNIGALLRTADAANVDAVLIANPKTDMYNPNIIRSSVGCVFTNTIGVGSTEEIIEFLHRKNINIFCAALQEASVEYHNQDYSSSTAIVVGTEATGLSDKWLNNATKNIIIPMQGVIDSMNVSVAAGILLFEAKRQRNFN